MSDRNSNSNRSLAVILGGQIDLDHRKAIDLKEKPRVDILEMEQKLGAKVFDYGDLVNRVNNKIGWRLLSRQQSLALTLSYFRDLRSYDFVYASGEDVGLPLALLLRLTGASKPYLIMRLEQLDYGRTKLRKSIYQSYVSLGISRANRIVCRTSAYAEVLRKKYKVSDDKIVVFPETTDTEFFYPELASGTEMLSNLPDDQFILSAGLEMRDYETLLMAVRSSGIPVVIAAGSPWSKFDIGVSNKLPENVIVSRFRQEEMRELYSKSTLVVVPVKPTIRACGMNVVLEAWSMGKPVIASRTQGLSDYITDGVTGRLVEPGDPDELQVTILELLADQEQASYLAENASNKVRSECSLDRYIQFIREEIARTTINGNS